MIARRSGKIVNIATIITGTPYSSLYEASKHALMGLTKCLMYELAPYGITVNAISPGAVDTELLRKGIHEKAQSAGVTDEFIWQQIASTTPLGRICTPADVAATVAFLAAVAVWPSPKNLSHLIALSAAVLIGVQFWHADRGGAYVLWYLPLVLLMVFRPNLSAAEPPEPGTGLMARWAGAAWRRVRPGPPPPKELAV